MTMRALKEVQSPEYKNIACASDIADFIIDHGVLCGNVMDYYGNPDTVREAIKDHCAGKFKSATDFVQEVNDFLFIETVSK